MESESRTSTRDRFILATARLLQHRGYHGTSLSDILDASGAPRGSLYFHFPGGKEELALTATRAEVAEATELLRTSFETHEDPGDAIQALFAALAEYLEEGDFTVGCPVAPLILDSALDFVALAQVCQEALAEWHSIVQGALERAGIPATRAATLATMILAAEEGAILLARAERDAAPLRAVGDELAAAARAALPAQAR